jgi:predicted neutral ceramidase superfamily lipid hydrolase
MLQTRDVLTVRQADPADTEDWPSTSYTTVKEKLCRYGGIVGDRNWSIVGDSIRIKPIEARNIIDDLSCELSATMAGHKGLDEVVDALVSEIDYQNHLSRRTDDEAKDVPGFLTLLRVYLRKAEDAFAMNAGNEEALHELRKVTAIGVRAMMYCGSRRREE